MTTKMLALVFGIAAIVSAGLFPAMDWAAARSEQAEIEAFAAEPCVVTANVIDLAQKRELALRK